VEIDEQRFQQVALNYFSNAIKFTPKQGRVALFVSLVGHADEDIPVHFENPIILRSLSCYGSSSSEESETSSAPLSF